MKFIKEHGLFLCILAVCAVSRLIPLFQYQLTYDEIGGIGGTEFNSFGEMIEKGVKTDVHPVLVQALQYYIIRIIGYEDWALKLPFILFSLGTVIYGYAFGLRNFSKQAGVFNALVLSFSLIFYLLFFHLTHV